MVQIPIEAFCRHDVQLAIFAKNVAKDPGYAPYCMRCSGLVRMQKVAHLHWKCKCGAEHDQRDVTLNPAAVAFVAALP